MNRSAADVRALPAVFTVRLTTGQEAALFALRAQGRDRGALRYLLVGERTITGTRDELALAAHRIAQSLAIAEAVRDERRTRFLSGALARIARVGIDPVAPEGIAREGIDGAGSLPHSPERDRLPDAPRPPHHSTLRRKRENMRTVDEGRGSPPGARDASKRAWQSKRIPRARRPARIGDRIFDIDGEWLRAGSTHTEQREHALLTREGRARVAHAQAREPMDVRIARAVSLLRARARRVIPSAVAALLVAEDVRGGKFKRGTVRARRAQARYLGIAQQRLPRTQTRDVGRAGWYNAPPKRKRSRRAKRSPSDPNRGSAVLTLHRELDHHKWIVSPARQRRTCAVCGDVQRKQRGRWVPA